MSAIEGHHLQDFIGGVQEPPTQSELIAKLFNDLAYRLDYYVGDDGYAGNALEELRQYVTNKWLDRIEESD